MEALGLLGEMPLNGVKQHGGGVLQLCNHSTITHSSAPTHEVGSEMMLEKLTNDNGFDTHEVKFLKCRLA